MTKLLISSDENQNFYRWFVAFTTHTREVCRPELLSDLYEEHLSYLRSCLDDRIISIEQFESLHCHLINLFVS